MADSVAPTIIAVLFYGVVGAFLLCVTLAAGLALFHAGTAVVILTRDLRRRIGRIPRPICPHCGERIRPTQETVQGVEHYGCWLWDAVLDGHMTWR